MPVSARSVGYSHRGDESTRHATRSQPALCRAVVRTRAANALRQRSPRHGPASANPPIVHVDCHASAHSAVAGQHQRRRRCRRTRRVASTRRPTARYGPRTREPRARGWPTTGLRSADDELPAGGGSVCVSGLGVGVWRLGLGLRARRGGRGAGAVVVAVGSVVVGGGRGRRRRGGRGRRSRRASPAGWSRRRRSCAVAVVGGRASSAAGWRGRRRGRGPRHAIRVAPKNSVHQIGEIFTTSPNVGRVDHPAATDVDGHVVDLAPVGPVGAEEEQVTGEELADQDGRAGVVLEPGDAREA